MQQDNIQENKEEKKSFGMTIRQILLKTYYPKPTVGGTIILFIIIGIFFIALGIVFAVINSKITMIEQRYDNLCSLGQTNCKVTITIPSLIPQPIFLFYGLTNFYQNHRRYIKSKSNNQLAGIEISTDDAKTYCDPLVTNYQMGKTVAVDGTALQPNNTAWPCGLIAKSVFTDTYTLADSNGNTIGLFRDQITWPSDKGYKFKNGPGNWQSRQWADVENESFIVWMRTSGLPNFKKLYARITQDLKPGVYTFTINNNYNSAQFDGTKSIVISNAGIFGGKNIFLEVGYFVFGGICFLISIIFKIKQHLSPDFGVEKKD